MTVPDHDFHGGVPPSDGANNDAPRRAEYALIGRVRIGDQEAFATLVATHIKGVTRFAYAIVGSLDAADDVAQSVFIYLWEHRASLDPTRPLMPYLFRIVRNRAFNEWNANAVRERYRDRVQADAAAGTLPASVMGFEGAVLNAATLEAILRQLPERRRLAIRLRFNDQLTHAEIGEVLEISAEAAEKLVFRALKELREILEVSG